MKVVTTSSTPAFMLDPTLPWLRTDPAMQQQDAFVGMRTITLTKTGYAPMGLYFPGGTTLAMVQVTKMEDLTPGLYWHEHTPLTPAAWNGVSTDGVLYSFGRFEGFGELTGSDARRHKKGRAHITLDCDTLEGDLRCYYLREDGTTEVYVNFGAPEGDSPRKIWRVTHYVNMPFESFVSLGEDAEVNWKKAGLADNQRHWLAEEKQLQTLEHCSEYSAYSLGGLPQAECRAILKGSERDDFTKLLYRAQHLTGSQAKKRKGAVAIRWRSYAYDGQPIGHTYYLKQEDAQVLLDFLQSQTELTHAMDKAAATKRALSIAAAAEPWNQVAVGQEQVAQPNRELALAA